jgi:hypothetical protein
MIGVNINDLGLNDLGLEPVTSTIQWKSCCLTVNPSAVKYFIQIGVLSSLIVFSATMLVVDDRCESQRNFSSLLMVCLGTMVPAPKMN